MLDWPIAQGSGSIYNPAKEGLFEFSVYGNLPEDKTAPVFSGVDPVSVEYGSKFDALAGVSAKDDRDGDVTKSIKVEGSVDTSKPGEQKLVYTVSDKAGNVARAERVVTVKAPVALSAAPTRASVALIEGQQLDLSGIKANVTYSDGSVVKDVDIDWPAVDVSKPGDVKVQGTVRGITDKDGKALSVTVTVKVAARVITSVTPTADPITVPTAKDSDSAPAATGKVVVKWNDGTEETRDVNLTLPQGWNQQIAEHQVTATGRTDGWEKDIPFTVTVEAATVERIDNPADFTTQVKRVPDLSNIKAKVTWSNGRVTNEKVTWQKPDDTVFDQVTPENEPIVVNGTVLDGQYVNVRITVVEATVESVDNLEGVELKAGEDPDEVLPHAVNAHWSNGTTSPVAVTWKSDGLDFSNRSGKDKTVQVTGTVTDWNGTVTVNVTVHSAVATKAVIVGDSEFTVDSGTAPDLKGQAGKAKVTWNDGGADSVESIVWGSFEGYKERRGGDFTVYGAVKGLSVDAQVHVNAATPVKLVKDHVDVTTEVGKVPTLPKTLQVVWSNGDVTDEAVKWDSYDAKKLDKATKFDVSGTVTVPADASEQATETKEFDAKVSITVANKATEKKPGLKLPGTGAGIALIAVVTIAIIAVAMTVLIISKRKLD